MSEEEYRKIRDMIDSFPENERWVVFILLAMLLGNAIKGDEAQYKPTNCWDCKRRDICGIWTSPSQNIAPYRFEVHENCPLK